MTNSDYTAIAVVLDRSGSMGSIKDDAIGALKQFVKEQKNQPGKATFTLAQFDDSYDLVYDNVPLDSVNDISLEPRGTTALLDAIGKTIVRLGETLSTMSEGDRPGKVLVAIVTDGMENASREWTRDQIFSKIKEQQETYNWDFVFLAANQDAIATAAGLGINRESALDFDATGEGVRLGGASLSNYAASYRSTGEGRFKS